MDNQYDKIFKENVGEFFLSLSQKYLGMEIINSEELKDKLHLTIEKEVDFVRKIKNAQGEEMILQLEFQTSNDPRMLRRMQLYFALLQEKFNLPVKQFVIYLGEKPPKMPTTLKLHEVFTGYPLINMQGFDYESLLASSIPEEILLATLGNYPKEDALEALGKIISRLQKLSPSKASLHKYIRQLTTLARLRSLTLETQQILEDMGLTYNIEKDAFFRKGIEKANIATAKRLLATTKLSIQQIANATELTVKEVEAIAKQI